MIHFSLQDIIKDISIFVYKDISTFFFSFQLTTIGHAVLEGKIKSPNVSYYFFLLFLF